MFFNKKNRDKGMQCKNCKSQIDKNFSYCPYCGAHVLNIEKERLNYGLLGRNDIIDERARSAMSVDPMAEMFDKLFGSIMNNLMKGIDSMQFQETNNIETTTLPNGIKIKFGVQKPRKPKESPIVAKEITEEQLKRMNSLPRDSAKTNVRRFSDKILYELEMPGVNSVKDIFLSKIESGYELKAIGEKKVYVNSIPIDLPIRTLAIDNGKLFVEFVAHHN